MDKCKLGAVEEIKKGIIKVRKVQELRHNVIVAMLSIKHDLARSCFQFLPKIGDEGDKISRKKLAIR